MQVGRVVLSSQGIAEARGRACSAHAELQGAAQLLHACPACSADPDAGLSGVCCVVRVD